MKKLAIIFFALSILNANTAISQLNYSFASGTSAYANLTGATTTHAASANTAISGNINIGFTFQYGCTNYTQLQICTEGWMGFGGGLAQTNANNLNTGTRRVIAPLWDNLRVGSAGLVRYRLTGTAPNRVFTVEWYRMRWQDGGTTTTNGCISFQAALYEGSNNITLNYTNEAGTVTTGSASIGLSGAASGSFYSVNSGTNTVSSVTETNNISVRPAVNTLYTFSPVVCSGTPTSGVASASTLSTNCAANSVNFSLTGATTGCGATYQWQSSPDNSSWTNIIGATGLTYITNVVTTTYFRCLVNCTNSGLSATSNVLTVVYSHCGIVLGGTASTSAGATTCASASKIFTLAGASSGCGITYQWQYSLDNSAWVNIAGATGLSFTSDILGQTYIRCVVFCPTTGLSVFSNTVTVTSTATPPANDLPCSAVGISLGAASSGDNTCSGNSFEPAAGSCWTGGTVNTIWYSIVAPASGQLKIKTIIQSGGVILQRTQIALYGGSCTSMAELFCNQSAPACGGYVPGNSEITATGLTPGVTYFISVDGLNSTVGEFSILAIDGTLNFPYVEGQDCPTSFTVCNPTTTIGNPGYQAIGGSCDHNTGNCTNGEANSIWYVINIDPALVGTTILTFDIVPNDFGNPNPITGVANPGYVNPNDESDYDYVLWKVAGSGATNCAGILAGAAPVACNYSNLGTTGSTVSGNAPAAYPGFDGAYEIGPTVSAGDSYVLVIQNYANSTSGFSLQIPVVSPVVYTPPTTVYWSGGAFNTSYTNPLNWGGCNAPACGVSAIVTGSSSNQPVLPAGSYYVNNLTINAGASLTLQSGSLLRVCGNFTNNGSLICDPGSTIRFEGTGTQTITGAFENSDGFGSLHILKASGTVDLANNIDVKGDFYTQSITSIFNTNGLKVSVAGNFGINNGATTYTNIGTTGELLFFGSNNQTYNMGAVQLNLNIVTMEKTAGILTLVSNMFLKPTTGKLNLTTGIIQTNAFSVRVENTAPNAVTTGNTLSYVNGNLWRNLNTLGSYDFPVGTASLYERANINFTAATAIPQLRARFDPWAGTPNTLALPDCSGTATYSLPSQNMGIWTITATASGGTGTYNATLYSTGATNTAGAVGWTVEKATTEAGPWGLNGTCSFSTVSVIQRNGMSGFSVFGVAQSTTPLPIELTNFQGYRKNDINFLKWTTASEINTDYFTIERSRNGVDFETIEKITAQGNSNLPIDYLTSDIGQFGSINYYRLKSFDNDGAFEYSKIISITSAISSDLEIDGIYPNPGTTAINFNFSVSRATDLNVTVIDNSGRPMLKDEVRVEGNGVHILNTEELAKGFYFIQITSDDGFGEVFRWIKK